jgi:tetratricopeptide (TPR) repeat protein
MSPPERRLNPGRSAQDRFGYELRQWRKKRGLSQGRLGLLVHVSGDLIQRIEVGDRRPSHDLACRCDEILRASGAILRAWQEFQAEAVRGHDDDDVADKAAVVADNNAQRVADKPETGRMVLSAVSVAAEGVSVVLSAPTDGGGPAHGAYAADRDIIPCRTEDGRIIWVSVPRRGFLLAGAGALASAVAGPPVARNRSAAKLVASLRSADGSPFERFETMRKVLMDCDNLFGPMQVMQLAHEQIMMMDGLRKNMRGSDHHHLLSVEVQFADLLSWLYQDSGNYRNAQYWLGRALDWSHISDDAGTVAFILARKSQLAGQFRDGVEAVEVADAAMRSIPENDRSAVIAITYAAHGYALRDDKKSCLRAYDRAHELLGEIDAENASWYGNFLSRAYVEVQRAHSLSVFGDYGKAAEAFQVALDALPDSYYRDRGVYLARKANAHTGAARAGQDDAEEHAAIAAKSGLEALAIGIETRSGRIHSELIQVGQDLTQWHRLPAVEEFSAAMTEALPMMADHDQDGDIERE